MLKFLHVTLNQKAYLKHNLCLKYKFGINYQVSRVRSNSQLLIITHHIQNTLRNNNWYSIQQHIQWKEFQRGIWYKMFYMHLISSIFTFSDSNLAHCIHNEVLHIPWKFYSKIFHIRWFIEEKPFLWILPMSDDSNN